MKKSQVEEEIGFEIGGYDTKFEKGKVHYDFNSYEGDQASFTLDLVGYTKEEAIELLSEVKECYCMLDEPEVLRDYEIEMMLHEHLSMGYYLKGVCKINGFTICDDKYFIN